MRSKPWALAALLAFGLAGTAAFQGPAAAQAPAATPAARPTPWPIGRRNPVADEMRALMVAIDATTRAIANDDLAAIPPALHAVHAAREATERAIRSGAYRPPRDGGEIAAFVALDEAFHDELVALLRASRAGDRAAAARQLGPIMNGCVGCHQRFR